MGSRIRAQFEQPYTYNQFIAADIKATIIPVVPQPHSISQLQSLLLSLNTGNAHYKTNYLIASQRVFYLANITFSSTSAFTSESFQELEVTISLTSLLNAPSSQLSISTLINIEFLPGAGPYFENITKTSPTSTDNNPFYLSNSFLVFSLQPRFNPNQ